ncbi:MAG: hypothetical protein Q4D32_08060 [Eubacteriales bacterium]|nr:hypothetical protein [Eubacteriales bacterium]
MKVAFWSPSRESLGVTTNMACIAGIASMSGAGRTILLENHYSIHNIADIILPTEQTSELREQAKYYAKYGIEYVLKQIYAGKDGAEVIHQSAVPLLYERLLYLPQSYIVNREVFNYEFGLVQEELFRCLERAAEYVFVDTETNRNLSSNVILSDADLIVVNLKQDPQMFDDFFRENASIREKAVYLIGSYQKDFEFNLRRICYEYQIDRKRIGAIPLNTELVSAAAQGRLLQFLSMNFYKACGRENDYFMRQLKRATMMLRQNMIQVRRNKAADDAPFRTGTDN